MKTELKKMVSEKLIAVLEQEHIVPEDRGKIVSYTYTLVRNNKK